MSHVSGAERGCRQIQPLQLGSFALSRYLQLDRFWQKVCPSFFGKPGLVIILVTHCQSQLQKFFFFFCDDVKHVLSTNLNVQQSNYHHCAVLHIPMTCFVTGSQYFWTSFTLSPTAHRLPPLLATIHLFSISMSLVFFPVVAVLFIYPMLGLCCSPWDL